MTDETKRKLHEQLASEIEFKIRLLERRAAIHAQTIYPTKELDFESLDYGLEITPHLITINKNNEESSRAINECNQNRKKLLFIKNYLDISKPQHIVKCLANNEYICMTVDEIKVFLQINSGKKKRDRNPVFKNQYGSTFTFTLTLDIPFRPERSI